MRLESFEIHEIKPQPGIMVYDFFMTFDNRSYLSFRVNKDISATDFAEALHEIADNIMLHEIELDQRSIECQN